MSDYTAEEFAAWKAWFGKFGTQEMGGVELLRKLSSALEERDRYKHLAETGTTYVDALAMRNERDALASRLDSVVAELRQCYKDDGCTPEEIEYQLARVGAVEKGNCESCGGLGRWSDGLDEHDCEKCGGSGSVVERHEPVYEVPLSLDLPPPHTWEQTDPGPHEHVWHKEVGLCTICGKHWRSV